MEPQQPEPQEHPVLIPISADRKHSLSFCICWHSSGPANFVPGDFDTRTRMAINNDFVKRTRKDGIGPQEIIWGDQIAIVEDQGRRIETTPMMITYVTAVKRLTEKKYVQVGEVKWEGFTVEYCPNRSNIPTLFEQEFGIRESFTWDGNQFVREDGANQQAAAHNEVVMGEVVNPINQEEQKIEEAKDARISELTSEIEETEAKIQEIDYRKQENETIEDELVQEIFKYHPNTTQVTEIVATKKALSNITNIETKKK